MSRRDRPRPRQQSSLRQSDRGRGDAGRLPATDDAATRGRLTLALLPLRLFLGVTFLYAGLDKLIDPTFLRESGPGSIGSQLDAFVRVSPIAVFVELFGQPFPILTGLLVAVGEVAIGLGTLSGLLFRLSASAGAVVSILFWLTASWATKPYYFGPDLPYAFGWLTLALAGHGGRYTLDDWLARRFGPDDPYDEPASADRRRILQGGVLGLGALVVAALGGTVGSTLLRRSAGETANGAGGTPAPDAGGSGDGTAVGSGNPTGGGDASSPGAPSSPGAGPSSSGSGATGGDVIGKVSQLASGRSIVFQDPTTGDPGVVVKLADGKVVAYDAVCTHAGCTVEYDAGSSLLFCPCHGATFDPAHDAEVLGGPTRQPLTRLPIKVDTATGTITLQA